MKQVRVAIAVQESAVSCCIIYFILLHIEPDHKTYLTENENTVNITTVHTRERKSVISKITP